MRNGSRYDYYECKECEKRWLMSINGLITKFPHVYQFNKKQAPSMSILQF